VPGKDNNQNRQEPFAPNTELTTRSAEAQSLFESFHLSASTFGRDVDSSPADGDFGRGTIKIGVSITSRKSGTKKADGRLIQGGLYLRLGSHSGETDVQDLKRYPTSTLRGRIVLTEMETRGHRVGTTLSKEIA